MKTLQTGLVPQWIETSKFLAGVLAVCFSIVEHNKVVTDNPDSSVSVILRFFAGLFKTAFAGITVSAALLWLLYAFIGTYNLINQFTEGFVVGPSWLNPPFWILFGFLIPIPFCLFFLTFIAGIVWAWLKPKMKALFPG